MCQLPAALSAGSGRVDRAERAPASCVDDVGAGGTSALNKRGIRRPSPARRSSSASAGNSVVEHGSAASVRSSGSDSLRRPARRPVGAAVVHRQGVAAHGGARVAHVVQRLLHRVRFAGRDPGGEDLALQHDQPGQHAGLPIFARRPLITWLSMGALMPEDLGQVGLRHVERDDEPADPVAERLAVPLALQREVPLDDLVVLHQFPLPCRRVCRTVRFASCQPSAAQA